MRIVFIAMMLVVIGASLSACSSKPIVAIDCVKTQIGDMFVCKQL